jgi:hypothetical protein
VAHSGRLDVVLIKCGKATPERMTPIIEDGKTRLGFAKLAHTPLSVDPESRLGGELRGVVSFCYLIPVSKKAGLFSGKTAEASSYNRVTS